MLARLCQPPLAEFCRGSAAAGKQGAQAEAYDHRAHDALRAMGLLDDSGKTAASTTALCMIWELRQWLPESLSLAQMLPRLCESFVEGRPADAADSEALQIQFLGALLQ